jgi:hypothetical protein
MQPSCQEVSGLVENRSHIQSSDLVIKYYSGAAPCPSPYSWEGSAKSQTSYLDHSTQRARMAAHIIRSSILKTRGAGRLKSTLIRRAADRNGTLPVLFLPVAQIPLLFDMIAVGRLNPIPEVQKYERLVTLDCVCRHSTGKEKPMDRKMFRIVHNVVSWLKEHMIGLVLLLSLMHVGLAYIHSRDSG